MYTIYIYIYYTLLWHVMICYDVLWYVYDTLWSHIASLQGITKKTNRTTNRFNPYFCGSSSKKTRQTSPSSLVNDGSSTQNMVFHRSWKKHNLVPRAPNMRQLLGPQTAPRKSTALEVSWPRRRYQVPWYWLVSRPICSMVLEYLPTFALKITQM